MRRVRKKGGSKEKVFGCDLLDHLNTSSQEIPLVLRCCSEFVEKNGIVDGIYRLSGVSSNIQKLRGEFESDGSPDLNKDVYLQDIHCVSSLCKAYFRELPNPLLTYQLYDKFAEAVAIQLEEERLVKISDVLKELPTPHHRTLEFLMRHLVRMASYSSETNMHARNLAIVWAPNLLRSKDIEVSGFNGTAAFMEVRVQSIVVEFILTHVPQLFPSQGVSQERRSSLPSPTAASCGGEGLFRPAASPPVQNFGNISPGDGPLAIRPYHAIIEGTDKRKGSLKGRKWMSIFNIGGRFHDPRRRHKHSAKEKERPSLRPARSMDSLSTSPYPNEGSRHPAQRPPPNTAAPVPSSPKSDVSVSTPAISGSEYAVTYRRGTGLVSGGTGTQGTYTSLDPEGLGLTGGETLQSRSPGLSTKVGRRAAMHITGPTMVTVPLHITSNLALGVLQGGGADRVVHRGREKDGGDRKESIASETKKEEGGKEGDEAIDSGKVTDREPVVEADRRAGGGGSDEEEGGKGQEEEGEEVREENKRESVMVMRNRTASRERAQSFSVSTEEDHEEADDGKDVDSIDEYMDMRDVTEVTKHDILNSTEVEDDMGLSGYVQDNFEFLDQMDCSVLDHMDCGVSYQANEFSVEPPGHSDDEYEAMEQYQSSHHPAELCPEVEPNPHRPLSMDAHNRHTKSLSLPYITSPVHGLEGSSSEEAEDDGCGSDSSDVDESMFTQSLPSGYILDDLRGFTPDRTDRNHDGDSKHQEEANTESAGEEEQKEEEDEDDVQLEEKETTEEEEEEVQNRGDEQENQSQSRSAEEDSCVMEETQSDDQPLPLETLTHLCPSEDPTPSSQESNSSDAPAETAHDPLPDPPPFEADACVEQEEDFDDVLAEFVDFSTSLEGPQPKVRTGSDESEDRASGEVVYQGLVIGTNEREEDVRIEIIMEQMDDEGQIEADGREEESVVREEEEFGEERGQEGKTAETEEDGKEKLQDPEELETNLQHGKELDGAISREAPQHGTENVEHNDGESNERKRSVERRITIQSLGREFKEVKSNIKDPKDDGIRGFGSKLIVSKQPKFHQVKAVPVVPPKPQHCKITALTLKHQQQQRERREITPRAVREDEGSEEEGRKERRRDVDEGLSNRNSPLSMNFEEAVAMATMKREKERECEKGKERQKD